MDDDTGTTLSASPCTMVKGGTRDAGEPVGGPSVLVWGHIDTILVGDWRANDPAPWHAMEGAMGDTCATPAVAAPHCDAPTSATRQRWRELTFEGADGT